MASWKVELDGAVFYDEDLTLADARWLAEKTGIAGWGATAPLRNPECCTLVLACFIARRDRISRDRAVKKADDLPLSVLNGFASAGDDDRPSTYTDGLPDPTKADPGTGTSS